MFAIGILALVIQEGPELFQVAVVGVLTLHGDHQVYSRNGAVFLGNPMHDLAVVFPSEYVYRKIRILPFQIADL